MEVIEEWQYIQGPSIWSRVYHSVHLILYTVLVIKIFKETNFK